MIKNKGLRVNMENLNENNKIWGKLEFNRT